MVRLRIFTITTLLGILIVNCCAQQNNARSYDTNDWIPVSRPRYQNEDSSVENDGTQKRPTGRVLNLPSSDQKRFFPTESDSNSQPYRVPLNTNLQGNQQQKSEQFQLLPKYQQELTTYVPSAKQQQQQQKQQQQQQQPQQQPQQQQQQKILLPPQLQSIINQNQPLLSPQRINSQLLQQPYLNASEFNSKDVVQNINLGLYKHQQNVKPTHEPEEVQLLYVPLENLRQRGQRQQIQFPQEQVLPSQQFYNQPYQQHKQIQLQNIQHDFAQQALQAQKLQEQFNHNIQPVVQQQYRRPYHDAAPQTTTSVPVSAPKKRKPHQPPLAVYMGTEGHPTKIEIDDVLSLLKDAKSISVQDNVGPASPQVFVGPSHLEAPDGYVKFDLPYLSSIESNRVERKVDQLPFFVAPLSYKTPPGYSKIPFPAPHVGSVVINHLKAQQQQQEQQREQQQQEVTSRRPQRVYSEENYSEERPTVKTRGRPRQPSRNVYTASTIQTPVSAEIPYGPLPTKNQHHTVQETLVSLNPYGPTQFVQTTTPAIYENPASLHEQIFSTKNRFSTPSAYVQNSPVRQNQYQQHTSTEPTPSSSTLSGSVSNDKYTVLEEFSITKNPPNKYQESQSKRYPLRNHQIHQTDNYYNQEVPIKEALPLVSSLQPTNQQYLEPESHPKFTQNHDQKEYTPTQLPTQIEYETPQPIIRNTPSQLYEQAPKEQQVFTQTQQSNDGFELPQRHQEHTQTQQSVTEQTNNNYEIPQRHHTPTKTQQTNNAYEEPLRQKHHQTSTQNTIIQQVNDAYDVPKRQPHHTQNQQTNDGYDVPKRQPHHIQNQQTNNAYDVPQQQHLIQHHTQTQPTNAAYEIPQRHSKRPQLEEQLNLAHIQQNSNEYEVPQRQRIQETSTRSQIQHSSNEYEIPQRHHQRPQHEQLNIAQQSSSEYVAPQRQRHQETSTRAQTRFRGKQHFTPDDTSKEEYDYAAINDKTTEHNSINQQYDNHETPRQDVKQLQFDPEYYRPQQVESQVTVTREPVVEYHLPIQSSSSPQFIPEAYYSEESVTHRPSSHEYTLPKQLPPISPQLPGLVNSLQDQALRPLLAPLLLPTPEAPIQEITSEYYEIPSSTTTTTTTPLPIIQTTTKRTRGRQRATRPTTSYEYSNTTPNPTSRRQQSSYRGRRPYNGRVRPEYTKQINDDNVQISSTSIPEITEGTTRTFYSRNRPVAQRQTTEQPRRAPATSRPRFRTRGRPVKDDEFAERSTTEHTSTFRIPEFEGGFQASVPMIQPTVHPDDVHHVLNHQPRQDQSLVYVQNKPTILESSLISTEQYLPNRFGSSTESLEAEHLSTLGISGPENNIVSDVIHNAPTVLINSNPNPKHVRYDSREQHDSTQNTRFDSREQSEPKTNVYDSKENTDNKSNNRFDSREQSDTTSNIRFDSREQSDIKPNVYQSHVETNIPNSRYEEPEVKIQPTTELTRTRTRIRGRPRVRTQTTARYQPSTTQRTTTESQDESKEFYGFFRAPNFAKPIQMEYKQASELRTPARPTIAYIRQSEDQNGYSTPHSYIPQIEDNYADHNIQSQYVSSTSVPTSEEIIDIKPITRRPTSNFARARRPTGPVKVEISSEAPVRSDKYFARGTKRPEAEPQKVTRIRGRIRKPARPTTAPADSSESSEAYQYTHSPRTNEFAKSNSAEIAAPVKTRSRISNRGKSHFQSPTGEKVEPESNNYPPSYLQAQQSQHHDSKYPSVSSTQQSIELVNPQEINTPRPSFQLTIEPEEVHDEYLDQVPYSSVVRPKVASVELDEGEESKFSAKVVEKPSNFNYIIADEKSSVKVEEILKKENESETTTIPGATEEKPEEIKDVSQQATTPVIEAETSQSFEITTELPTTTMDATTEQQKRKGFWRLVNFRPLEDEFESAESQRVGTVLSNEFTTDKKHTRKYQSVNRIRTTEPPLEETTTTLPETTVNSQSEVKQVDNAERDMFANLYEMFGFSPETSDANHNDEAITEPDVITTEVPTEKTPVEVEITTISNLNSTESSSLENLDSSGSSEDSSERDEAWYTRIIGTSTTTEISHETEICYRGRCIKSMTSEENSESL